MRNWRNNTLNQHLYTTAIFWGSKVFTRTREPHDGFWLAQSYFAAGMYSRAERVLVGAWDTKSDAAQTPEEAEAQLRRMSKRAKAAKQPMKTACRWLPMEKRTLRTSSEARLPKRERTHATRHVGNGLQPPLTAGSQASTIQPHAAVPHQPATSKAADSAGVTQKATLVRLADVSVACRYLAAQAMIRQENWSGAMEMLGEDQPFQNRRKKTGLVVNSTESSDGGIKVSFDMSIPVCKAHEAVPFSGRLLCVICADCATASERSRQSERVLYGSSQHRRKVL